MSLEMKYFVLKPKGTSQFAKASRAAMLTFAQSMHGHNPEWDQLSKDVKEWAEVEALLAEMPNANETS